VGLGGNELETRAVLSEARRWLFDLLEDARASSLYRSEPQLDLDQEPFWNSVVVGGWAGSAESLLERLLMAEAGWGRRRDPLRPKGPRLIDLDLLLGQTDARSTPRLVLPHADLMRRRFALEPLLEVWPDAQLPDGRFCREGLRALEAQGVDRTSGTW